MAGLFDDTQGPTSPVGKSLFDDTQAVSAPDPNAGDFIPGVQRGLQNLQAMTYGAGALAGSGLKKLGAESVGQSLQDFGMEGYNRNIEEAKQYPAKHSFKDIYTGKTGIGGAIDWAQGTLGELVPSMVEAAGGAIIGSAVAPGPGTAAGAFAGRTLLKKGIEKTVQQSMKQGLGELTEAQLRKQVTGQALKKLGGKVGIGAAVMPMESGGMYADLLQNKGIDAPETALLFGALATSLEFAGGNSKLVDTFVDALSKGVGGTAKKSAKEILTNIPQEALQEGGQELFGILNTVANTDEKLLTADHVEQIIESMAAGAIGGGAGALVNAGMSTQAIDQKPGKTDQELELDKRASNILTQDKEVIGQSIQKFNEEINSNQEFLNDFQKLDAKAQELNIEPTELIKRIVSDNKNNQSLIDKINSGIKSQEDLAKKEYENLSPEDKAAKDIENKLTAQRIANEQKIAAEEQKRNADVEAINKREAIAIDQYSKEQDPEKKKLIADKVFNLRQEKNTLLNTQKQEQEKQANQVNPSGEFGAPKKADEIHQDQEDFYNQIWSDDVGKDAAESADIFQTELSSKNISDYVNHINSVKATDRQQLLDQLVSKAAAEPNIQKIEEYADYIKTNVSDWRSYKDSLRAKIDEQLVNEPDANKKRNLQLVYDGLLQREAKKVDSPQEEQEAFLWKSAEDSANTFLDQHFTNDERLRIEDYWQGVKKELNLTQEEMTPGTEASMRKKFFETKLGEIEGNVKRDAEAQTEPTQNIVPSLAEQNKRQAWFQQTAKELGDFQTSNKQTIEPEIPRGLPGSQDQLNVSTGSFTNEQQVGQVPQLQTTENQSTIKQVNLDDIKTAFPGQEINQSSDGPITVKFKNGQGLTINSIQDAGQGYTKLAIETGQMSKEGKILGITVGNEILLDQNFADNKTLWHENKHVLDNLGMIREEDNSALNREFNKLRKSNKLDFALSTHEDPKQRMVENRANMFAQIMVNRETYRGTTFGKVIQRVMDFFQQMLSFGKQTVSGLAREVESGKIYERQVAGQTYQSTVPQAETTAKQWYSVLEQTVNNFQQKQATPDQWKGMIKNVPGIKAEELEWIGLNEWLDEQQGKVTKEALASFIKENNVQLEEVYRGTPNYPIESFSDSLNNVDDFESSYVTQNKKKVDYLPTKYEDYQLPGGKNYKELLLTLPQKQNIWNEEYKKLWQKMEEKYGTKDYFQLEKLLTNEDNVQLNNLDKKAKEFANKAYQSNHWDEPNILAHIRFNERTDADGNKVLFLEEIQSDWHQEGRKEGYQGQASSLFKSIKDFADTHGIKIRSAEGEYLPVREYNNLRHKANELDDGAMIDALLDYQDSPEKSTNVPNAPFKKSSQWSLLAMKRMVRYAAENGFNKIAWTTGQQQFDRYSAGSETEQAERLNGMQEFYDKILPNTFNKEFNRGKWGNAKVEIIESNLQADVKVSKAEALKAFDEGKMVFVGHEIAIQKSEIEQYQGDDITTDMPTKQLALPITNRMRSKALREGIPLFQVAEKPEQKLSDAEYNAIYTEKNNLLKSIAQNARMKFTEIRLLADKALGSISTRLKNVDPELSEHLRWLDFNTSQKIIDVLKTAKPLLDATKVMSPEDKSAWNWARLNSDEGKINQISNKYNLVENQEALREKLNQIRKEAIEVGYDVGFIEEYWPRVIKDQEGFLQATQEISQRPVFTEAIRAQAKKLGISQEQFERDFPEVKADIISNLILGQPTGIGGPGNIQSRVYETIPKEYAKFYMDADAALMQYVYSMTKKIEARKFFGKVPQRISDLKSSKKQKQADLIKYNQLADMARAENPERLTDLEDRISSLNESLTIIDEKLNAYKMQRDYTENIGAYIDRLMVDGRIEKKDEKMVRDILDARFHEHGTTGIVNAYKNLSYIDTMGSPISAITQIGDLAWAMYVGKVWTPSGFLNTGKNLVKAISGTSEITKEDLGIERIAQEFADGTTLSKAVNKVFKYVGLEKIDTIGKEVLINNALAQFKAQAKADPKALARLIRPTFGKKSTDVVQELLSDNPSENVKMLLYSRLLDFQPVALSEMPEKYLNSGNGRVFYMLKTYTIKQFDVFRKEVVHNLKSDNPQQKLQGLTNMVQLMALLTIANAGADELKDLLLGRETKFSDHVIENFLTMGGASRFLRMQVTKEGFGSALSQQILPPMKFANAASKDIVEGYKNHVSGDTSNFDHARIIDSIPGIGKLYYWHYGRGSELKESINEQEFKKSSSDARLFKKQLENSQDKRLFIQSNVDRFKQMKLQENFQAALNRNQAVINKLKKIPSTANVQKRLGQLKIQRENILKKYVEIRETL
jgi:hypothetical protein